MMLTRLCQREVSTARYSCRLLNITTISFNSLEAQAVNWIWKFFRNRFFWMLKQSREDSLVYIVFSSRSAIDIL